MASDQNTDRPESLRRERSFGDGSAAPGTVMYDADGVPYSRTYPVVVEEIPSSSFFGGFLVDEFGSAQMAGDWRFTGTPIDVHNGLDDVQWTGNAVVGSSVTFNDSTRGFGGSAQSILIANMSDGDIFDLNAPGPVDVSGYVALEIRVWVVGNYAGDVITVEGWDGAATVGTPVNLADHINASETGGWQSAVIPREDLGFDVDGVITGMRIRQGTKIGPAPTISLDNIKFQQGGGARVFSATAPPGFRIHIEEVFVSVTDAFTLTPASGSAKGVPPLGFFSAGDLENGLLAGQMINGAFLAQGVMHNFRDTGRFGFDMEDPLTDGTDTSVRLTRIYKPPIIVEGVAALNSFEIILSDELPLTDVTVLWTGKINPL